MKKVKIKDVTTGNILKVPTNQANVNLTIDRYEEKIEKLQKDLDLIKARQWKYRVGETVLYKKDLRRVEITKLIDNDSKYLYEGHVAYTEAKNTCLFTQEDLIKYSPWDYEKVLIDRIWELEEKLNKYKQINNIF